MGLIASCHQWFGISWANLMLGSIFSYALSCHIILAGSCGSFLFYIISGKGEARVNGDSSGHDPLGFVIYRALLT